ncbi:heparan-alpha-glucosaminide N-acetyltransferase domain-containing protein [Herbiconiux sp. CPCC 205716]|uniref:Heparan-alpha-glucosaminide N-acetyltransferase domain-containing protein n=1 Tax=Herbiconiux gentiana TaxID=2970912 RepID=A0ABT2GAK0_9MICO|nr:heparan-alpha-glucosaminide N-acetyltransferase domain-containing protein [Herbiconiux gentiana]MCS5713217.1 heparan-alpha-glucosaminide N-acetyltransferase domain-containing protein [Herbiconiux gentiana]
MTDDHTRTAGALSEPRPALAEPPAARRGPRPRFASLDLVRGLMLVATVLLGSLLAAPEWVDHAVWASVHPADVLFPVFVTLSGCGLAFALRRGVRFGVLLRRTLVLLAAGLLYSAVVSWSWDVATWRVTGVLQIYAAVVVVLGLLHLVTRSWWGWAVVTALFAVADTVLLSGWAERCVGGVLTRECNPSGAIDTLVFSAAHIYQHGGAGHDPEGLVAVLGALVSASAGVTVGHLLLAARRTPRERPPGATAARPSGVTAARPSGVTAARPSDVTAAPASGVAVERPAGVFVERPAGVTAAVIPLVAVAAAFLAAAVALTWAPTLIGAQPVPMMKRLWTSPFALTLASATTIALLLGHLLVDRPATGRVLRGVTYPLLALGRNSLLVYFGSHVLMSVLNRPLPDGPSPGQIIASTVAVAGHVQLSYTAVLLLFWVLLTSLLHRHRLYLRP